MVTNYLEDLIHKGLASVRTMVVGAGGTNILRVPENNYIVITQFKYFYFNQFQYESTELDPAFLEVVRAKSVQQISFSSPKSFNHFIIKSPERLDFFLESEQENGGQYQINGHCDFDTYMVHSEDVIITIVTAPGDDDSIAIAAGFLPGLTKAKNTPLDIGTIGSDLPEATTLQLFHTNGAPKDFIFDPVTKDFSGNALGGAFPNPVVNNLQFAVTNQSKLDTTIFGGEGVTARVSPIVNIQYVMIQKQIDTTVAATTN